MGSCWSKDRFLEVLDDDQKRAWVLRRFGADFGTILERFGGPKWTPNRVQICFKSDHGKSAKMLKNHWFFNVFGLPGGSKIGQKWVRNRFENGLKLRCQSNTQRWPKNGPRWSQNGPKLGPCWAPKSSWARPGAKKNDTENGTGIELENHTLRERGRCRGAMRRRVKMASPGGLGGYLAKAK